MMSNNFDIRTKAVGFFFRLISTRSSVFRTVLIGNLSFESVICLETTEEMGVGLVLLPGYHIIKQGWEMTCICSNEQDLEMNVEKHN